MSVGEAVSDPPVVRRGAPGVERISTARLRPMTARMLVLTVVSLELTWVAAVAYVAYALLV